MKKHVLYAVSSILIFVAAGTAQTRETFIAQGYAESVVDEAEAAAAATANVSPENAVMDSSSRVDWAKQHFISDVTMDVIKAGIPLPSGKSLAVKRIQMELPVLVKDPLLSLFVDDSRTLSDVVLEGSITLEELTRIIDGSSRTPAYFTNASNNLKTTNTIRLQDIGALLVKHHKPYTQEKPIDRIASRAYTGIVIDARGILPVQGEFVTSQVQPCLFPRIWDENMTLVYERNMVEPDVAVQTGIVDYLAETSGRRTDRAGKDPLWITAKKVYGINRCDPVISYDDYLRITTIPENLELLRQGKVVILLDKDELAHSVTAAERNTPYYLNVIKVRQQLEANPLPDLDANDTPVGLEYVMSDLHFIPDSPELLPEERPRVRVIADQIKGFLESGPGYTIQVDGHTAKVDNPVNPQILSQQRAKAIVDALIEEGIDADIISWYGFGDTQPLGDNATPEGRALNRRVVIKIMPRSASVQRR